MGHLSISLKHFQLPLSFYYSSQHVSCLPLQLILYGGIFFFFAVLNVIIFSVSFFSDILLLVKEMQQISVY